MELLEEMMGAMERASILKLEALHPVKKIRYGSRRRRVGPKRQRGPFKRAVSAPSRLTTYMAKRRLEVMGEDGPEIRMPIGRIDPIGIDALGMPIFSEAPAPEANRSPSTPSGDEAPQQSLNPTRLSLGR